MVLKISDNTILSSHPITVEQPFFLMFLATTLLVFAGIHKGSMKTIASTRLTLVQLKTSTINMTSPRLTLIAVALIAAVAADGGYHPRNPYDRNPYQR